MKHKEYSLPICFCPWLVFQVLYIVQIRSNHHPLIICLTETVRSGRYINIRFRRSQRPSLFMIVFLSCIPVQHQQPFYHRRDSEMGDCNKITHDMQKRSRSATPLARSILISDCIKPRFMLHLYNRSALNRCFFIYSPFPIPA